MCCSSRVTYVLITFFWTLTLAPALICLLFTGFATFSCPHSIWNSSSLYLTECYWQFAPVAGAFLYATIVSVFWVHFIARVWVFLVSFIVIVWFFTIGGRGFWRGTFVRGVFWREWIFCWLIEVWLIIISVVGRFFTFWSQRGTRWEGFRVWVGVWVGWGFGGWFRTWRCGSFCVGSRGTCSCEQTHNTKSPICTAKGVSIQCHAECPGWVRTRFNSPRDLLQTWRAAGTRGRGWPWVEYRLRWAEYR